MPTDMTHKLVLLRHGQSQWNLENRFTGWVDVDITEAGRAEARAAGELMKAEGLRFDSAHTSVLKRAIRTLWTALDVMDQMWIPVANTWRLNERHYGALQGPGQGRDHRSPRRGAGQRVAAQLRHPAAADGRDRCRTSGQ